MRRFWMSGLWEDHWPSMIICDFLKKIHWSFNGDQGFFCFEFWECLHIFPENIPQFSVRGLLHRRSIAKLIWFEKDKINSTSNRRSTNSLVLWDRWYFGRRYTLEVEDPLILNRLTLGKRYRVFLAGDPLIVWFFVTIFSMRKSFIFLSRRSVVLHKKYIS